MHTWTRKLILIALAAVAFGLFGAGITSARGSTGCPCSLFTGSSPGNIGLQGSFELGLAFDVTQTMDLTAVRFYKDSEETGSHVGTLWDGDGNMLQQVTFSSESESGWQEQAFDTPLQLQAGTTYVLSVNVNDHFVSDSSFTDASSGPLETASGHANGIYNDAGSFPDSTVGNNYLVDAVVADPTVADPTGSGTPAKPVYHQPPGRAGYCDPKTGQFLDLVKGQDKQAPYSDRGLIPAHVDGVTGAIDCNFPPTTAAPASTATPVATEGPFSPGIGVDVLRTSSPRAGTSMRRAWIALHGSQAAERFQLAETQSRPWSWHTIVSQFTVRTNARAIWIRFGSGERTSGWQLVKLFG